MFDKGWFIWVFRFNPFAHLINAYRDIFYVHEIPNVVNLLILLGVSIIALIIGYMIFKKLEKRFAEEV